MRIFKFLLYYSYINFQAFWGYSLPFWGQSRLLHPHSPLTCSPTTDIGVPQITPSPARLTHLSFCSPPEKAKNESKCPHQQLSASSMWTIPENNRGKTEGRAHPRSVGVPPAPVPQAGSCPMAQGVSPRLVLLFPLSLHHVLPPLQAGDSSVPGDV